VLTLTALIEGLYDGSVMTPDTVTVELHNIASPYTLVETQKGILNSAGVGSFIFKTALNGTSYYLMLKHRNAIETWSSAGNTFVSSALSYNFTTSQSQAYGNNLVLKGGKYCIYSGDATQDGTVDLSDLIAVDNDNANFTTGYTATDLNGDSTVDLSDLILCDNNNVAFVSKQVPPGAPPALKIKNQIYRNN
jgi:hypothetical protein